MARSPGAPGLSLVAHAVVIVSATKRVFRMSPPKQATFHGAAASAAQRRQRRLEFDEICGNATAGSARLSIARRGN